MPATVGRSCVEVIAAAPADHSAAEVNRFLSRSNHSTLHAVDAGLRRHVAKACRHRAEIFADDDGAVTVGFQRRQAQQIVDGIGEIGAFLRAGAAWNDPKAQKPHDMIDAHAARVAQRRRAALR